MVVCQNVRRLLNEGEVVAGPVLAEAVVGDDGGFGEWTSAGGGLGGGGRVGGHGGSGFVADGDVADVEAVVVVVRVYERRLDYCDRTHSLSSMGGWDIRSLAVPCGHLPLA